MRNSNRSFAMLASLLGFSCTVLPAMSMPSSQLWQLRKEAGEKSYIDGDYQQAQKSFSEALGYARKLRPQDERLGNTLFKLGMTYERENQDDQAAKCYEEALVNLETTGRDSGVQALPVRNKLTGLFIRHGRKEALAQMLTNSYFRLAAIWPSGAETEDLCQQVIGILTKQHMNTALDSFYSKIIAKTENDPFQQHEVDKYVAPLGSLFITEGNFTAAANLTGRFLRKAENSGVPLNADQMRELDVLITAESRLHNTKEAERLEHIKTSLESRAFPDAIYLGLQTSVRNVQMPLAKKDLITAVKELNSMLSVLEVKDRANTVRASMFCDQLSVLIQQGIKLANESGNTRLSIELKSMSDRTASLKQREHFMDPRFELSSVNELIKHNRTADAKKKLEKVLAYLKENFLFEGRDYVYYDTAYGEWLNATGDSRGAEEYFKRSMTLEKNGVSNKYWDLETYSTSFLYEPYIAFLVQQKRQNEADLMASELSRLKSKLSSVLPAQEEVTGAVCVVLSPAKVSVLAADKQRFQFTVSNVKNYRQLWCLETRNGEAANQDSGYISCGKNCVGASTSGCPDYKENECGYFAPVNPPKEPVILSLKILKLKSDEVLAQCTAVIYVPQIELKLDSAKKEMLAKSKIRITATATNVTDQFHFNWDEKVTKGYGGVMDPDDEIYKNGTLTASAELTAGSFNETLVLDVYLRSPGYTSMVKEAKATVRIYGGTPLPTGDL